MKTNFFLWLTLFICISNASSGQIRDLKTNKFKIGIKVLADKSNDSKFTPYSVNVYSAGIPVIYHFTNSKSAIESGMYLMTKGIGINENEHLTMNFLSVPVNYRYDFNIFYSAAGMFLDYLIATKNYNTETFDTGEQELRNFYTGFNISAGLQTHFIKQYYVFIEARAACNIGTTFTPDRSNDSYGILTYGIAVGVNYQL